MSSICVAGPGLLKAGREADLTRRLPDPAPTRFGHLIDGWFSGEAAYDFSTPVTGNLTLTAAWTAISYDVVFDSNGGTGTMAAQAITFGTSANLSANTYTRDGYIFAGWSFESGDSVVSYGDSASFTMDLEGITLYAQWTEEEIVYEVGDIGPAGGTIFFVDTDNDHDGWTYLEAAPADYFGSWTQYVWNGTDYDSTDVNNTNSLWWGGQYNNAPGNATLIGDGLTAIGTGLENSIAASSQATGTNAISWAYLFYEVEHNGEAFTDWFLPSRDELEQMYDVLELSGNYWSSSETSATNA